MIEVGEYVVVLPTKHKEAYIAEVVNVRKESIMFNGDSYRCTIIITKDGLAYGKDEVLALNDTIHLFDETGNPVSYTLTAINLERNYIKLNDMVVFIENFVYNNETELIEFTAESALKDDDYKKGWIDCFREIHSYLIDASYESIIDKVTDELNISISSLELKEDDFERIFNKRNEIIERNNEIMPQLTLDEIKERLGYDFELI